MNLDNLADYYATLPERLRAEREAAEDAIAREVTSGQYKIEEIAAALGITRQQVTRITKAARARWTDAEPPTAA